MLLWVLVYGLCFLLFSFFFFEFGVVVVVVELILFSLILLFYLVSLYTMYFDLNCDAECNGVNVGCLGVSVIGVI